MEPIRIAVIDDGVCCELSDESYEISGDSFIPCAEAVDCDLHGSNCAEIIKDLCDAKIISLKAFNDSGKANAESLSSAIRWCIDNKIRLVNMSVGTVNMFDAEKLATVCHEAYSKGVIISAAVNNRGFFSAPACLPTVIGVEAAKLADGKYSANSFSDGDINFRASGVHISEKTDSRIYSEGSSFAAPRITALIYKIMTERPDCGFREIKDRLKANADSSFYDDRCSRDVFSGAIHSASKSRIFLSKGAADIPCIIISGSEVCDTASLLRKQFRKRGFYPVVFSEYDARFITKSCGYYNADVAVVTADGKGRYDFADSAVVTVNVGTAHIEIKDRGVSMDVKELESGLCDTLISIYSR